LFANGFLHPNFQNPNHVEADPFDDIDFFYTCLQIHSTMDYQTPMGYGFSNSPIFSGNLVLSLNQNRGASEQDKCTRGKNESTKIRGIIP